jgi:sugar lactone lactonase YvrE
MNAKEADTYVNRAERIMDFHQRETRRGRPHKFKPGAVVRTGWLAFAVAILACAPSYAQERLWVSDWGSNAVSRFSSVGVGLGSMSLASPTGIAFDSSGNAYVGSFGNLITKYSASGANLGTFASTGLNGVEGLAVDRSGNVYAANWNDGTVTKFTPAGGGSVFASGFSNPGGLALDASGNLYVANVGGTTVQRVTPGGVVSTFATGLNGPGGVAFDAGGDLYVSNLGSSYNGTTVERFSGNGAHLGTFASGLHGAFGLAFDASGNLLVANFQSGFGSVDKFASDGTLLGEIVTGAGIGRPDYLAIQSVPEPSTLTLLGFGGARSNSFPSPPPACGKRLKLLVYRIAVGSMMGMGLHSH